MKFINLSAQYKSIKNSVNSAVFKTLKSGSFILGKNVKTFEEKISKLVGAKYAVGVNSGTDALFLSLKALDIGSGDEVITTPFSFIATAEVIANCGARPVFVDIEPETFNIDADKIEGVITKRTKAIIPVHLYGQMADMDKIMRIAKSKRLYVIEDAAQAIGASQRINMNGKWRMAGSIGTIGCFSFFPTKNLSAAGDAGMAVTNNKKIAERLRMLRNHGAKFKYYHELLGYSSRLDEIQAAILLVKLSHLSKWNRARQRIANQYRKAFSQISDVFPPVTADSNVHVFHQYTIRIPHRDALKEYLGKRGIPTAVHYPLPLHFQPALKYLGYKKGDFPEAERVAHEVISLPIYPELTAADINRVIKTVKTFFTHHV